MGGPLGKTTKKMRQKRQMAVGLNRYSKLIPGRWTHGLQPAGPWWLNFDPYPNGNSYPSLWGMLINFQPSQTSAVLAFFFWCLKPEQPGQSEAQGLSLCPVRLWVDPRFGPSLTWQQGPFKKQVIFQECFRCLRLDSLPPRMSIDRSSALRSGRLTLEGEERPEPAKTQVLAPERTSTQSFLGIHGCGSKLST